MQIIKAAPLLLIGTVLWRMIKGEWWWKKKKSPVIPLSLLPRARAH